MAEPHLTSDVPRRRGVKRPVSSVVLTFAFILVAGIGFGAGALAGGTFGNSLSQLTGQKDLDLSSVQATYRALQENYDGKLDTAKLTEGANRGLVEAAGDEYTVYMDREEATEFDNSLTGNIGGGIGVEVGVRNDLPTAVRVLQDNPAQKAGVMAGDIIMEVNGDSTADLTLNEVVDKIRGESGTTVRLGVVRDGEKKEFTITREEVNNPSAYGEVKNGVGVLTISRFDQDTGSLARVVANDFKKQGVKGVVLDLRGNGGGYVNAAQAVAGIWLDEKVVVSERRGTTVTDELKSGGNPILNGIPTVVLVNESSASASEIVAGALRDHKAATLLGTTTFGKGSVQKLLDLTNGAMLKVTVARWYTPNGLNISEKGINPDKTVERSAEDINADRDPQLDAAIGSLQ